MSIMEMEHIFMAVIGTLLFIWSILTISLEGQDEIKELVEFYEEEESYDRIS